MKKLIYVQWLDSCMGVNGWSTVESHVKARAAYFASIGWLIAETEDSITLASHISEDNHPTAEYQCCGVMTIPKVAITSKSEVGILNSDRTA